MTASRTRGTAASTSTCGATSRSPDRRRWRRARSSTPPTRRPTRSSASRGQPTVDQSGRSVRRAQVGEREVGGDPERLVERQGGGVVNLEMEAQRGQPRSDEGRGGKEEE